ncbi:flagellar basal-body rod protein FlgF [Parachitinimonas caeni]|uniref:Flagellar basal-body rod protein FlgF n=1 Tax=Parachitinimonas caeni TaxID=3031301 RepID=A0ABT7DUJ7_9NEIS|nr:flagellar basal-body rod protein FlgF [Parachitinimonas caeni]MDK2123739.1 flagellar basal-body rod protein FlgF [Parachitinimonas caeni]
MDRMIYIAMTGASQAMNRQATVSNNLANAATPGFRAELAAFRALPVVGEGAATRAYVAQQTVGSDFSPGVLQQTNRDLDVAVEGAGWIAVQANGGEAYTRDGSFEIDANGLLRTRSGLPVIGDAGPITLPPGSRISIARDGTVSASLASNPSQTNDVGRIKLVNPDERTLERGSDGLFRPRDGSTAQADASVKVSNGSLERSNVNVVESLVDMIGYQRHYEMQLKLLQTAEQNASRSAQILTLS